MLVLSRKQTERLRLGKDIVVTVLRVGGDKVRLGIEAPSDVVILRDELQPYDTAVGDTSAAEKDASSVSRESKRIGRQRRRLVRPRLARGRGRPPRRETISGTASA